MEIIQVVGVMYDANVFVVKEGGKALIVDCGAKVEDVKRAVGQDKVLGVLLTHGHYDHSMFAPDYAKAFSCPVYMHECAIDTAGKVDSAYGEGEVVKNFDSAKTLQGDGEFQLGDFKIGYFSTPGHSKCSICYLIGDHLFAGDTVFNNGVGRTDLIGSSRAEMVESLEKLSRVRFEKLHSGHGTDSDFARQTRNISVFKRFLSREK